MMLIDFGSGGDGSTNIILSCAQCISFLLFAFNINSQNGHGLWLAVYLMLYVNFVYF